MTTDIIYNIIKSGDDYLETYEKLKKLKYSDDIIELVFLVDFDIYVSDLIIEKQEKEKRKYQCKLRRDALRRYSEKCVISGQDKKRLLEVAHIKAVKDCKNINEKRDINNTLLLWLDLHRYFDDYEFSINPETLKIEVNLNNNDNEWLLKYNNMKIDCINNDMIEYINYHYTKYKKMLK